MKAYVITVEDSLASRSAAAECLRSSAQVGNNFVPSLFKATTPKTVEVDMASLGIEWNYPDEQEGPRKCPHTGMTLPPYKSGDVKKRIACFASHARLWAQSERENRPILILEHDATFLQQFPFRRIASDRHGMIGINDPRRATRKANVYHFAVVRGPKGRDVMDAPGVDGDDDLPQGIAGASAYMIKPWAAKALLEKAREIGAWPNDALACKQLFPFLGQTTEYYTTVQRIPSSLAQ